MSNVLTLRELSGDDLAALVERAIDAKRRPDRYAQACQGKGLLVLMQKTSTRTALSVSSAIFQMGGYAVSLDWNATNFSISPARYEIEYASRNCHAIVARLRTFEDLDELARYSHVPVINGCCNRHHPLQALADLVTIRELLGRFDGATVTYVGAHNNVANSLLVACTRVGVRVSLVTPLVNEGAWDDELMREAKATGLVASYSTLAEAAAVSDVVYTDAWLDMEFFADPSHVEERERRSELMRPFQVNTTTLGSANPYVMHPMPIHPGYEIAEELVSSERSVIFQQAENRLCAAKALLAHVLEAL